MIMLIAYRDRGNWFVLCLSQHEPGTQCLSLRLARRSKEIPKSLPCFMKVIPHHAADENQITHVRAFRNCVARFKILVCQGSQAYDTRRTHSPERKTDNEPKSIGFGWTATCAVLQKGSPACKLPHTRITACQ